MQIFHIAEAKRWEAATLAGSYAQSTLGRTLDEEGFIHACRAEQIDGVRETFYADTDEPLVLLVIDTDRLTSPWQEDQVGDDRFPHVYGPLNPSAVVSVLPLAGTTSTAAPTRAASPAPGAAEATKPQGSFMEAFLGEMVFRMLMAVVVMLVVLLALAIADRIDQEPLLGVVAGFLVGIPLVLLVARRRNRRLMAQP